MGSEMCIRDRFGGGERFAHQLNNAGVPVHDRIRFMRTLSNKMGARRPERVANVVIDEEVVDWTNEVINNLNLQLEKERQSRKISDAKLRALTKQSALDGRILELMETVLVAADPVEVPIITKPVGTTTSEHVLVALLSDIHIGEVVVKEQVVGLDEYNLDIFKKRINRWVDNLLRLTELKKTRLDIRKLEIFGLGDFISGNIHQELLITNETHEFEQVYHGVKEISRAFLRLAPHFEQITFTGVVGNHGRNSKKPYAKDKQTYSFDYLIYQMLSLVLQNQPNIKFIIPDSHITYRDVAGTRFMMTHGDNIRGALGIPLYGINRVRSQLREIFGEHAVFDMLALGHFHHYFQSDSVICNPSFKGVDEYSLSGYFGANRPTQMLLTIHPEHKIVSTEHIFLDDVHMNVPNFDSPKTWAEKIGESNEEIV